MMTIIKVMTVNAMLMMINSSGDGDGDDDDEGGDDDDDGGDVTFAANAASAKARP